MSNVAIVYWSGTGNTQTMAECIQVGAEGAGATVAIAAVDQADDAVLEADVLVLGCPSMGDEVLEEAEFEPFMESIDAKIKGKKIALFGSYGWGDGQWMREWEERVKSNGATLVTDCLILNETPDSAGEEECKQFGATAANA